MFWSCNPFEVGESITHFILYFVPMQKPGDESIDEVFHSPSLPSRSPGFKPQSHVPPNNTHHHLHPHPHPHAQYQSQDKQTPDSTSGIRNRPYHHHHHQQQHPTPDTHESPGQKLWQDEPVRKGPPPGYHHQRDWSPSSYEKPPQMMDHVDVAETRRGMCIKHPTPDANSQHNFFFFHFCPEYSLFTL